MLDSQCYDMTFHRSRLLLEIFTFQSAMTFYLPIVVMSGSSNGFTLFAKYSHERIRLELQYQYDITSVVLILPLGETMYDRYMLHHMRCVLLYE